MKDHSFKEDSKLTLRAARLSGAPLLAIAALTFLLGCAEGYEAQPDQDAQPGDLTGVDAETNSDGFDALDEGIQSGKVNVWSDQEDIADIGEMPDGKGSDTTDGDVSDTSTGDVSGGSDMVADADMGDPCDPMNCDPMACAAGCAPPPCNDTELLGGCYTVSEEVFTGSINFHPTDLAVTGSGLHLLGKSGSTLTNHTRVWTASQWTTETFGSTTTSASSTGYVLDLHGEPHVLLKTKPQFGATSYRVGSTYLCDGDWARFAVTVAAAFGPADGQPRSVGTIEGNVEKIQLCMPSSSPIRKMSVADYDGWGSRVALRFDANENAEVLRLLDHPPRLVRYSQGLDSWSEEVLYAPPPPTHSKLAGRLYVLNHDADTHVFVEFKDTSSLNDQAHVQVVYLRINDSGAVETQIVSPWKDSNGNWRDTLGDEIVDMALSPSGVPYMTMRHGYQANRDVQLFKVENGVVESTPLIDPYPHVAHHGFDAQIAFHPDGSLYHLTYDEANNLTIIREYAVVP